MARIAAAGDVHASDATRDRIQAAFAAVQHEADLILLAGDLTTHGEPEQARALAEAVTGLEIPVAAVLGNHDLHSGHGEEVAHCPIRNVLLHYAPTSDTLHGEPEGIWTYLGSDRLATPIAEYRPDVVLHGHAHNGSFEGAIGEVPVYNVAVHVTGRDFYVFDLEGHEVEVETRA